MNKGEEVVFKEVLPLLDRATDDLGAHVDEIAFYALARRLASRGYDWEEVSTESQRHFDHQMAFEQLNNTHMEH